MGDHRVNLAGNECCCRAEACPGLLAALVLDARLKTHRREEDHALARNRSVIGYSFILQAGV